MATTITSELHTALSNCWALRSENVSQFEHWVNLNLVSSSDQAIIVSKIDEYIENNTYIPLQIYPLKNPSELTDDEKTNVCKEMNYYYYDVINNFRLSILDSIGWDFEVAWSKTYDGVYFVFPDTSGSLNIKGLFFREYGSSSVNNLFSLCASRLGGKLTFVDNDDYTFIPDYQDEYGDNVRWRMYQTDPVVYVYPNQTIDSNSHETVLLEIATKTIEMNRKNGLDRVTNYPYTKDSAVKLYNGHTLKDMVDSSFQWGVFYSVWNKTGNMTVQEMLNNMLKYKKPPILFYSVFITIYDSIVLGDFDYTWGMAWDYTTIENGEGKIIHVEFKNESLHGNLEDPVVYDVTQDEWVVKEYTFNVSEVVRQ